MESNTMHGSYNKVITITIYKIFLNDILKKSNKIRVKEKEKKILDR